MKTWLIMTVLLMQISFVTLANGIKYHIDVSEPEHHLADVRLSFETVPRGTYFDVKMPQWRTGLYKILNLANGVRKFDARNSQGKPLPWRKIDTHTWRIDTQGTGVQISYQLYANLLGRRARHIDDTHAYLDASAVFMYNDKLRDQPIEVSLDVPPMWRSVSGMPSLAEHKFLAANFDVLVDSPIETGIHQSASFQVDGRDYELVVWGRGNYDFNQMLDDLKALVATPKVIWDGYPYQRYVFMVHATTDARGATEHLNSTVIQRHRDTFHSREDYLSFLSTASHELIHTWNVKAYRPIGLVPYDYEQENYSTLIWLSEGSTSYFQNQLLLRAGLMTTEEFFKSLAKQIVAHKHRPGVSQQTVAQSSFDTWIDEGGDRANNASVNIYRQGYMVSWLLDFMLQAESDGDISYRDVHNRLYQQYRLPQGFSEDDVKTILAELLNKDVNAWWTANVHGYLDIDFDQLLAQVGLTFTPDSKESKPWLGIKVKVEDGLNNVTSVERDSPAWDAGFTPNDVIIAIDDMRVNGGKFETVLDQHAPGDELEISFFRRDQLMKKKVRLAAFYGTKYTISPMKNPTEQQQKLFKTWLGVEFPTQDEAAL